ncbi:MAG: serine/threonine protein kinase [Planctomycetales bacterium]|nr:serine/threonine protein kinase [Planctomycetales bacterium]
MLHSVFESFNNLPSDLQKQIDLACFAFENDRKTGKHPIVADFVERVSEAGRLHALRELILIEHDYHRDDAGGPPSVATLLQEQAARLPELVEQLLAVWRPDERSEDLATINMSRLSDVALAPRQQAAPTADYDSGPHGSHGLHIRCPHCNNNVELLADTPIDSVLCESCGSAFSLVDRGAETQQATTLQQIGRFELISRLGVGGFGTVWKARDTELKRIVAIKIPRKGQLEEKDVEWFLREARSAAQLRHPNLVAVHEVGRENDSLYIVSDFIRGVTLADWLDGRPQPPRQTAEMLTTIALALHHAHEHGVIHRDLKPSNILMDEERNLYLTDFGLAKRELGEITMTVEGHVLGTPAYMSPEQARGQNQWIDRRTDVYSLGVMMFQMLTGELPFRGSAQMQMHRRVSEDAPDPRTLNRTIPRDLSTVTQRCLERDPNRRYASAALVADELQRFLSGKPIQARPVSRLERTWRWSRRKPALATAGLLVLFIAVAGPITAFVLAQQGHRLRQVVREKDSLITRFAVEKQQDVRKMTQLSRELDAWEGRADPWEYWPPNETNRPRRILLTKLLDHAQKTFNPANRDASPAELAYGRMGLAIMLDELERDADALEQYKAARELLSRLPESSPDSERRRLALAECQLQIARLSLEQTPDPRERPRRSSEIASAAESVERLSLQSKSWELRVRDLEMRLLSLASLGAAGDAGEPARVGDVQRRIVDDFPEEPQAVYELVCILANRSSLLLSAKPDASDAQ